MHKTLFANPVTNIIEYKIQQENYLLKLPISALEIPENNANQL